MADIQQLIKQITNNDAKIRDQARAALVNIGSDAVEPLIAALNSPSDWQRKSVITLLQQIKDKRVIPPLLNSLKDKDAPVRGLAALALAEQNEQSAVPVIQGMAEQETDAFARSQLVGALDKLGQRAWVIEYARRVLTESRYDNKDRQAIIQVIVRLKDPATADLLLEVFKKQEFSVSNYALDGLKEFKDPRAAHILIEQLKDTNPQKRAGAAVQLGNFGYELAIEPIKALLNDKTIAWQGDRPGEPSTTVGQAARDALKKLGSKPETNDEPKEEAKKPRWKFW